jgi:hypothetical protein
MLRTFTVLTWAQIEAKLGIAANTCNKIYLMACDDAGNTDFNDPLNTLDPKTYRQGSPPKV